MEGSCAPSVNMSLYDGDGERAGSAEGQIDTNLALQLLFQYYCRFGRAGSDTELETMDNVNFAKFLRDTPGLLDRRLTPSVGDLFFLKCKEKSTRRITYSQVSRGRDLASPSPTGTFAPRAIPTGAFAPRASPSATTLRDGSFAYPPPPPPPVARRTRRLRVNQIFIRRKSRQRRRLSRKLCRLPRAIRPRKPSRHRHRASSPRWHDPSR